MPHKKLSLTVHDTCRGIEDEIMRHSLYRELSGEGSSPHVIRNSSPMTALLNLFGAARELFGAHRRAIRGARREHRHKAQSGAT
eukprot:scaffold324671_cov59-Tisochrysis_lutea.AAC.1